ncbi:MAG: choline dehydrogenase [Pseudomonadales bacterium]|nr:choline dehydrogenase [Pseudomonadales bacterium]
MYDYIIVGGGSAGCVLANRLSKDPKHQVLLLEAGPKDSNPMIHMPGGCAEVLKSDKLNWKFVSTAQKQAGNARYEIPRGKTLGGSSSSNGMVYIRGHARDYDRWSEAGNSGWSYQEVLPLFKRAEDFNRGANEFHGAGGELYVSEAPSDNPLFDLFVNAGVEAGYPANDDFNGAQQEGIGRFHCTIKDGKRWSSASAFLRPAMQRENLTVICDALVTKVVMDDDTAVAVEYRRKNKRLTVRATKEIVISAGAIKSPHILQLSGIGDSQELAAAGIKSSHNLPGVGKNLQDHLDWIFRYTIKQPLSMNGQDKFPHNLKVAWDYFVHKRGIAACNNIEAGGFIKSQPEVEHPDIQLHFVPCNMTGLTEPLPPEHGVTMHACNLRPYSHGTVKAVDNDPSSNPEVDFGFMSDERDQQVMIDAFKALRRIAASSAWGGMIDEEVAPGKHVQTDAEILAAIANNTETVYHPVGTCKMGQDEMAVVDERLRVRGLKNLRVADASIIPSVVSGNTNAPSMMIGEKCAEMLLVDNA